MFFPFSDCAILFCDGVCLHCGYFAVDQKMSSSANSALNLLILGHSHIYWLGEHVRTGNPTGLFTDFCARDRNCKVNYLGIRGIRYTLFPHQQP